MEEYESRIPAVLAVEAPQANAHGRDLLVLERPFGVPIMRPAAFLRRMQDHY